MKILVTGAAGFIGFHTIKYLISRGDEVIGLDSINDYYPISLKKARLKELGVRTEDLKENQILESNHQNFHFVKLDLKDSEGLKKLFEKQNFNRVIHLAAQAGVRYSLENPQAYVDSNIIGFLNILECCRYNSIEHLTYASSSSVYGLNETMPFSVHHNVDHPISLYAASKKSNELMAHTYSHLFNLPTTGLRFFTVYGPWGRPDMAYFLFTKAILAGEPINIFNNGEMSRDFTYIDDIVEGVVRVNDNPSKSNENWSGLSPDPGTAKAPYAVYNIGNNSPVKLMDFIEVIESKLGQKAEKKFMPMQPGDVSATYADSTDLINNFGYKPQTNLEYGISQFVSWYRDFYKV